MGHFAKAAAGVGWPNPGWAPPGGYAGDTIVTDISHESAVQGISTFSAGIRLIAEDIAALPLITYESLAAGGKRRAPEHPAYSLLHDAPNPEMTSMVFRETGIGHMYSWGNWFAEKELNGYGVPVRLWPLRPDKMQVEIDRNSGKRIYKYRLPDSTGVIIPANRMFHVPGFGFDGLIGYSRVRLMRRVLEAAKVVEEYGLRTFANNASPGITLMHPQQLSSTAKTNIKESWEEAHRGLTNSQRTAVLDEGMTLKDTGFSPEDAQFLESRTFSVVEIARGLRLAPHKLSDLSRATFSNIEESNLDHVVSTLGPPCSRIEQQIGKDIIGDPRFFAEHLLDSQLRGKTLDRYMAYHMASGGASWLNADSIRERENMEPMPKEQGQLYLAPLNMTPTDLLAAASAANGASNGAKP